MTAAHKYLKTHPWLTFSFAIEFDKPAQLWALLGEAYSQCRYLTGAPLTPITAHELACVYLVKGALASTAIEGNTLSEAEARDIHDGRKQLPPSQRYLQTEVENVLGALGELRSRYESGTTPHLDTDWIRDQNRRVLSSLHSEEHVAPGEYTQAPLVVGNYRGAPPEDIPLLVEKLVDWLRELSKPAEGQPDNLRFFRSFLVAALGHLYIAWIHPFGDGNGRTARLLECAILTQSGLVPWVSTNLLSNHYNRTRTEYYRRLDAASKHGDALGFVRYAAEGFVDQLREQIEMVQAQQLLVSWINYVHEIFHREPETKATSRQRMLLLALELAGNPIDSLRRLTPELAERYAGKENKNDPNHEASRAARRG